MYYSVYDVAEILETNPETVRRWIREGKLLSEGYSTKKLGFKVSSAALNLFAENNPRYAKRLEAKMNRFSSSDDEVIVNVTGNYVWAYEMYKNYARVGQSFMDFLKQRVLEYDYLAEQKRKEIEATKRELEAQVASAMLSSERISYLIDHRVFTEKAAKHFNPDINFDTEEKKDEKV